MDNNFHKIRELQLLNVLRSINMHFIGFKVEGVVLAQNVGDQVVNGDGLAQFDLGKVGVLDFPSVDENDQAGTDGFHHMPFGNQQAGILTEADPEKLKIGMEMEMVIIPLCTDENGNEIVTFAFAPVA